MRQGLYFLKLGEQNTIQSCEIFSEINKWRYFPSTKSFGLTIFDTFLAYEVLKNIAVITSYKFYRQVLLSHLIKFTTRCYLVGILYLEVFEITDLRSGTKLTIITQLAQK